jgi:2-polyprenyl-3-methyl-5-hydroxy-6-metoxy-1,4-benzoquinol methylase
MEQLQLHKEKIKKFWQNRSKIKDPRLATHFKHDNALDYDLAFIAKYVYAHSHVLDLGCGTGAIANALEPHVAHMTVVDQNAEFLKYCVISPKVRKKTADIARYVDDHHYDVILLFGVLNYLNDDEVLGLYKRCHGFLKPQGKLLIKHACGIAENVIIDAYSGLLRQHYHALYRSLKQDRQLIAKCFYEHSVIDIYPKHLNPWPNTHFYAFIVGK